MLTAKQKFDLHVKVRARGDVTANRRLIFAAALDHFNCETGQCDPSATTLGRETALHERSARRNLEWLAEHGFLTLTPRQGKSPMIGFHHPDNTPDPGHIDVRGGEPVTPDTHMSGVADPGHPGQFDHRPRTNGALTPDTHVSDEPINRGMYGLCTSGEAPQEPHPLESVATSASQVETREPRARLNGAALKGKHHPNEGGMVVRRSEFEREHERLLCRLKEIEAQLERGEGDSGDLKLKRESVVSEIDRMFDQHEPADYIAG